MATCDDRGNPAATTYDRRGRGEGFDLTAGGRLENAPTDRFRCRSVQENRSPIPNYPIMFLDVGTGVVLQQTQMNDRARRSPDRRGHRL